MLMVTKAYAVKFTLETVSEPGVDDLGVVTGAVQGGSCVQTRYCQNLCKKRCERRRYLRRQHRQCMN